MYKVTLQERLLFGNREKRTKNSRLIFHVLGLLASFHILDRKTCASILRLDLKSFNKIALSMLEAKFVHFSFLKL